MFLSQKGSLGRNPMINRVGQRLLQLFEGASAAYSLRDLASNIASVVRVRRASDNSEKDFSAADVSSGAMTQWVNGQVVPPLDVRELVDGERTGALIPAAAAYSLRNLSTSYTGNVVDVRRSSDDAEDSFTAAEVADGTLTNWVSEAVTAYTQTVDLNIPTSSGSYFTIPSYSVPNIIGERYRVTFELKFNSGGAGSTGSNPRLRTSATWAYSNATYSSNLTPKPNRFEVNQATGDYQTYTVTFTNGAGTVNSFLRFQSYDSDDSYTVRNFTTEIIGQDGFVTQWYDQSGNGNHATQGTDASQPKIVDGGSLVSGGLSISSGQHLSTTLSGTTFALNNASSFVLGAASGGQGVGALTSIHIAYAFSSPYRFSSTQGFRYGGESTSSQPRDNSVQLFTLIGGSTTAEGFANGTSYRSTASSSSAYTNPSFKIGSYNGNLITGEVAEIIVYNSDQSDNRTAFEANIGETYGIDLPSGVDTGYDQVDGFVETWYDQSGNGNDAVQIVASSQPKIVSNGSIITDSNGNQSIEFLRSLSLGNGNLQLETAIAPMGTTNFAVVEYKRNFSYHLTGLQGGSVRIGRYSNDKFRILNGGSTVNSTNTTFTGNAVHLATADIATSGGTTKAFLDGVEVISNNFADATDDFEQIFRGDNNSDNPVNITELVIFGTNQSANRAAIETNINNQYDIY